MHYLVAEFNEMLLECHLRLDPIGRCEMKWSLKIGRFAGIDVYMHVTFLLLISWVALMHWRLNMLLMRRLRKP